MAKQSHSSSFPSTHRDISNLKQTATDAASDILSSLVDHASKAKGQLNDLSGHVREEGAEQIDQVRSRFYSSLRAVRDCASERPLAVAGVALAIGFLFGLTLAATRQSPRR